MLQTMISLTKSKFKTALLALLGMMGFIMGLAPCTLMAEEEAGGWNISGFWEMYTDGELDTTLQIYPAGRPDLLEGKVSILHRPQDQGTVCQLCDGYRKDQPVLNMVVLERLQWNPAKKAWYGQVLDPNDGRTANIRLRKNAEGQLNMCAFFESDYFCLEKDTWFPSAGQTSAK